MDVFDPMCMRGETPECCAVIKKYLLADIELLVYNGAICTYSGKPLAAKVVETAHGKGMIRCFGDNPPRCGECMII